jgi:predicted phosphodiesterase
MLFQYFSDLHMEFTRGRVPIIKAVAPYLIIAGDITTHGKPDNYQKLFDKIAPLFKYVFFVSGNHDYYHNMTNCLTATDNQIREMIKPYPNVVYLQNQAFLIPETDIVVFGGTFWSQIRPEEVSFVLNCLNDYRMISALTITETNQLHREAIGKLEQTLSNPDYMGKRFIVISHHLPSYSLISEKYKSCMINSAFATEIPLANDPRIVAWFCGHTHEPCEMGKFHVNPIGYPEESNRRVTKYDRVVDV